MNEPLQLIQFTNAPDSGEEVGSIELNEENLNRVLSQTDNRPLCIICVSGPSRQGKSFLLGYMIRCLEGMEQDETDWMDWDNKDKPLAGFKFRNGTKPETQGIWVWSKPFLINAGPDETPIAVLLMDTQGTYDEFISTRTTASIVGLSLLMSSCMIFNFFKNLQENVLTSLDSYIKYGQLALKDPGSSTSMKPFQKLTFLIRDWNNPGEYAYGSKGGKGFLDTKLNVKDNQAPEAKAVRESIKTCFETLDCFLMPFPGEAATYTEFKGSIQELSLPFAKKLEEFISNFLNPDDLGETGVKSVFGNAITASEFRRLLNTYIPVFRSKETPTPLSMMAATILVTNQNVLQKVLKKYQDSMRSQQRSKKYLSDTDITDADKIARKQALKLFKSSKKFGNAEELQDLEEELETLIEKQWKDVKKANQEKRSKIIANEMDAATKTFKEDLDLEFPFPPENPLEYYEESKLEKKAKNILDGILIDFMEKIGGEDGEEGDTLLKNSRSELEMKLRQYLSAHVILENQNRQRTAEKEVRVLLQNLKQMYTESLKKYLDEHPFGDLSADTGDVGQMKSSALEKFAKEKIKFAANGKKEPNFSGCADADLANLLGDSFTAVTNAHMVKLQERQQVIEKLINELVVMYENDMESAYLVDLEDLDDWHQKNKTMTQDMFEKRSGIPKESKLFRENLDLLLQKLEGLYETAEYELHQQGRAAQQQLQTAMEESFSWYHQEMIKHLSTSSLLTKEEYQRRHKECTNATKLKFKDYPVPTVTLQSEGLDSLIEKMEQDFSQLSIQHERDVEMAKCEAKNLVAECHGVYQKEMTRCAENVKSEDKLREGHAQAQEKSIKMFKDKCPVKDDVFMMPLIEELTKDNEEAFEEVLELFEMKISLEVTMTAGMIADCRTQYDNEMGTHFRNEEFIRPDYLDQINQKVCQRCVEDCARKAPLTQGQRVEIMDALMEAYQKWKQRNDMNLECDDVAIGIDLGTTYSCAAVYAAGKCRVIPNRQGKNTTPSYVAFQRDGSEVVGEPAKSRAYENPENTIFDAKRIIGRKITDVKLQEDMRYWPFTVEDDMGIPKIIVDGKKLHPEQISAKVLRELKEDAERYLKRSVKKAVITVPAYFTDGQRQATKDAGDLAQLEVLQVLTEPVAAAIAYKKQHADTFGQDGRHRNTLIFDLGGGTFDVAVLKSKQGELETLALAGDDHLGGNDFDQEVMKFCVEEFKRKNGIDLADGKDSSQKQIRDEARRRLKRLQGECERKKMELTSARMVEVVIDGIYNGRDLRVTITRDKFEELNALHFRKTLVEVEKALTDAKIGKGDIHDIVLVGGSTRIPKVQEMLRSYFGGKALDSSINPDEAVAYGAAMKAAMMHGSIAKKSIDFTKIQDVTPMSIGVEVYGGGFSVIIPKNTRIPVKAKERYRTAHNNQTSVQVTIYQGEEDIAIRNRHLGDFYLNGIPPNDAEVENIDVEMVMNAQGILHVNAVCSSTGRSTGVKVTENKQRMSRAEKCRLLGEVSAA